MFLKRNLAHETDAFSLATTRTYIQIVTKAQIYANRLDTFES